MLGGMRWTVSLGVLSGALLVWACGGGNLWTPPTPDADSDSDGDADRPGAHLQEAVGAASVEDCTCHWERNGWTSVEQCVEGVTVSAVTISCWVEAFSDYADEVGDHYDCMVEVYQRRAGCIHDSDCNEETINGCIDAFITDSGACPAADLTADDAVNAEFSACITG